MSTSGVVSARLTDTQLEQLAEIGEERTAEEGDALVRVGERSYPFMAILEGEAAILDAAGNQIVTHPAHGFIGELGLMSGQSVFLNVVATKPMRYIAVDRHALRRLMVEDAPLADLLLTAFNRRREHLQQRADVGIEIVGPRSSADTRRLIEFARRLRLPYQWNDDGEQPLIQLPDGVTLTNPSNGELSRALGIGLELAPVEEVDLLVVGGGPAGLGAAVYGASEGLETLVIESAGLGGQAGASRRIENYLGFPAGISGTELTSRAITQARKFGARTGSPYQAVGIETVDGRHVVKLDGGQEVRAGAVVIATGAEYRRLPVEGLEDYEGLSVFYAAGPAEGQLCTAQRVGVVGGGNSAAQAAIWLARGGALVTLLHRRADLSETMSDYLISDLERYGVAVRDRSEIVELHGADGELEAVTLKDGERLPFGFLFLFLGAVPCTEWLGSSVATDDNGFILTGHDAGADGLLETSLPGVFAAGDVRSGSIKRCATAVGDGAAAVRFVHEALTVESRA